MKEDVGLILTTSTQAREDEEGEGKLREEIDGEVEKEARKKEEGRRIEGLLFNIN